MGSTFNTQILVEKLARMNSSQQSIETLSHWCIFHMNKAKQVVETWDRQFHCSPRDQRLAFLYLANDILQNSRRKGSEFVGEFWKVLPGALRDVIGSEDDFARNAAIRLVRIWEERKVFGSRGQILKEEFVGRQADNGNRNGKHTVYKLGHATGNALDRIVSSYELVCGGEVNEDSVVDRCKNAITSIEEAEKEIGCDLRPGSLNASAIVDELEGQHAILRDCIEQLTSLESSRANLVSYLRDALHEQEHKLDQVHNQLQAVHVHSEQAENICRRLLSSTNSEQILAGHAGQENHLSQGSRDITPGNEEQSAVLMCSRQPVSCAENSGHVGEDPKSAAAAVAAKLRASPSSARMLSDVLSSLASEGVIRSEIKESSGDYPSEKRPKLENDHSLCAPENPPAQVATFLPPGSSFQQNRAVLRQGVASSEQPPPPPPPSSPPPLQPLPPMQPYPLAPQYMPSAGVIPSGAYGYSVIQQQPVSLAGYPPGAPVNGVSPFTATSVSAYQSFPSDGSFYSQTSSLPMGGG